MRDWTYPHSFNSPQPLSNSLGDACSAWIFRPALTLTRARGLATVICRLRSASSWVECSADSCVCVTSSLFVSAVPLELSFSIRVGPGSRVACATAPRQSRTAPGRRHDRLVALESPPQQTRVATVQAVLGAPTDGPHLSRLRYLPPGSVPYSP